MVKVPSSTGGVVTVEIKGVSEALRFIRRKGKDVEFGADSGVFQAANFLQQEVQESAIGNRAEPKSVDTGRFANSIDVDKIKKAVYKVFTKVPYAKFLEFGSSRMNPRRHFNNSLARNKKKIREIIDEQVTKKVRRGRIK